MITLWFTEIACEGIDELYEPGVPQSVPLALSRALDALEAGSVPDTGSTPLGLEAMQVDDLDLWIVLRRDAPTQITVLDVRRTQPIID
ncbi:MAG: hypothetical protein WBB52_11005 [Acidimicrobiales bacterium]